MHENPIAVRSKSRLAEALGLLLQEKQFDAITITELCTKAKLSRPAFYQNFNSIRDVAARYLKTALSSAAEKQRLDRIEARSYTRACIAIYEESIESIDLLMKNNLSDIVVVQCTEAFLDICRRYDYRILFAASGLANALAREDGHIDRDELCNVVEKLVG